MISRLNKVLLTALLVVGLFLAGVPILAQGSAQIADTRAVTSEPGLHQAHKEPGNTYDQPLAGAETAWLMVKELSLDELTARADSIVVGKVTDIACSNEGGIHTVVTLSVEEAIQGWPREEVVIKIPGGEVDGLGLWVSGTPSFHMGERVVVFLKEHEDAFEVAGRYQGKFTVVHGWVLGTDQRLDVFLADIYRALGIEVPPARIEAVLVETEEAREVFPSGAVEEERQPGASETLAFSISMEELPIDGHSPEQQAVPKPTIVSRTGWECPDGQESPRWPPSYYTVSHVIVHHTATPNTDTDWPARVRQIWDYHANQDKGDGYPDGWGDIGYHYLIDPHGVIYEGRAGGDDVIGAHVYGHNVGTMGVGFLGTFCEVEPTPAALSAAEALIAWKCDQRNIDPLGSGTDYAGTHYNHIGGHRDLSTTACPGDKLYNLLPAIRQNVYDLISNGPVADFEWYPGVWSEKDEYCPEEPFINYAQFANYGEDSDYTIYFYLYDPAGQLVANGSETETLPGGQGHKWTVEIWPQSLGLTEWTVGDWEFGAEVIVALGDDLPEERCVNKVLPLGEVPEITSVSPDSGSTGTGFVVTIHGSNFGASQGDSVVGFWMAGTTYVLAPIVSWSDAEIVCQVPAGASSGTTTGGVIVVTEAGPSNNFPFYVTFSSLNGLKWPEPDPMGEKFLVNPNTADADPEDLLRAVIAASQVWNEVLDADFYFEYGGPTTRTKLDDSAPSGQNEVFWVQEHQEWVAVAQVWSLDGEIVETNMAFNDADLTWSTSEACPSGSMDVWNVATHEFGHWLMLLDLYGDADSEKTMYGFTTTGETKNRSLHDDDIAGIRWLYPGTGTRGQYHVQVTNNYEQMVDILFKADTDAAYQDWRYITVASGQTDHSFAQVLPAGMHTVSIQWTDPATAELLELTSPAQHVPIQGITGFAFTIPEIGAPVVSEVIPDSGYRGQTLDVTITGTNFVDASEVCFGAGITVSFDIDTDTQITAEIGVAPDAAVGPRDVSVTNPLGTGTLTDGFTVQAPPIQVTRKLPAAVTPGQQFDVVVTWTAPENKFEIVGLSDEAPAGWMVAVDADWCSPKATSSNPPVPWTTELAEYLWFGPYDQGVPFSALYKVQVPPDAKLGTYTWTGGALNYYVDGKGPFTAGITGDDQVTVADTSIAGQTTEVNCDILAGTTVTAYLNGVAKASTVSDNNGNYILALPPDSQPYTVVASRKGFRDETRTIDVPGPGTYTLDFVADHGLVPCAPDMAYVLDCIYLWRYGETPCKLSMNKVLDVIYAWRYPC